ncbi:unnamed protein product [Ixodes persulcatus]
MATALPPVPDRLKAVAPYVKIAAEHDARDPVIAYWCRLYALQNGMKVDRSSSDCRVFLMAYMDWLEKEKSLRKDDEAISSDVVAQAHIENRALKLFLWADGEDRAARFNKNVVKAFYTAGFLFDILTTFGELTEEITNHRKYARWKAAYIHRCLKNGEQPIPGPLKGDDEGFEEDAGGTPLAGRGQKDDTSEEPLGGASPEATVASQISQAPSVRLSLCYSIPQSGPNDWENGSMSFPRTHKHRDAGSVPEMHPGRKPAVSEPRETPRHSLLSDGVSLQPDDFHKAQKYCKYAGSALQYEDVSTAIDNLQKALRLLTTGSEGL